MQPNVMIGDAFLTLDAWNGYMSDREASGVIMDLVGPSGVVLVNVLTCSSTACVSDVQRG